KHGRVTSFTPSPPPSPSRGEGSWRRASNLTLRFPCLLSRQRFARVSVRDLLRLRLVNCFLESFDGFSEAFTQLGELTGPEHDEDDDQHQQQFHPAKSEHSRHLFPFRHDNHRRNPP